MVKLAPAPAPQFTLLREEGKRSYSWHPEARDDHWWLLEGGKAVAFGCTFYDPTAAEARCILQEVEVQASERGRGLSKVLIGLIEEAAGERLWTDGGFTELGFTRLAALPLAPGAEREACYRPQTFVRSWDARLS